MSNILRTSKAILSVFVVLVIAGMLLFGSLAHTIFPHEHSVDESVTNLLHSALRHEDKKLVDLVPPAPLFVFVLLVAVSVPLFHARALYALGIRTPLFEALRRGIVPYRRFG